MAIPEQPALITRAQVIASVEALGLDPTQLATLEFNWDSVKATVYEVNEQGSKIINQGTEDYLKQVVVIPIQDTYPPKTAGKPVVWEDETYVPFKRDGDEPSQ